MNSLNHIPFLIFPYSKSSKEPSVSSTFVMLSSILDDVMENVCRQSSGRVRGVGKYEGKDVFKVKKKASLR